MTLKPPTPPSITAFIPLNRSPARLPLIFLMTKVAFVFTQRSVEDAM